MQARPNEIHMLHDNSFDKWRGWGDGLLYIPGRPHQIRPMDDLGVVVSYLEDGSVYISVEPPLERAEYDLDSLQLETSHPLCVACKDTLNYYCRYIDELKKV